MANGSVQTGTNAIGNNPRSEHSGGDRHDGKSRDFTRDLKNLGESAKDAAQEKLEQLSDSASDYYKQGKDKVQDMEKSIEDYVRERPVKSILIAAGIGLLLGRFWMRP